MQLMTSGWPQVVGAVYNEYRNILIVDAYERKVHQELLTEQVYEILAQSDDHRLYWDDFKLLFSELLVEETPDAAMVRLLERAAALC